ncbi:pLS20_p028 family conjugation system transmembrane protein [Exiguobacterium sp. S22-S28]|uniref:pLS20_p028 family conjugation system transmembrane protein n=1 Tax=Exiguobacterium sp. S22-S28 TaxID=3342768 RepID=UPI00372CF3EA
MSDAQVIQKLTEFERLFNLSNLVNDALRTVGWIFVRGLSLLIDSLESLTDDILMIKTFFNNPQVVEFVQTIQPFLYVLLAASFVFTGYLIIFQKKFDREGLLINIFISLMILGLLSPTMKQLNDFTDQAVNQAKSGSIYGSQQETISETILKENLNDLVAYDKNDFDNYTENEVKNNVPTKLIKGLQINEVFDSNKLDVSTTGSKLSKSFILWDGSEEVLGELDQSGLDWNNQYYYRYHPNWLTILVTLGVMGFTLFSIAYKLARLSFELAFNYVLAILVAPADLHSGQKTKKVIQSILNTFLVIILIFVSIKLYTIGTAYLADTLDGLAYLIALIAFSAALIDGPNMVERLFGIDAGLKRGWGLALGAYAVGKGTAKVGARVAGQTMKMASRPATPSVSEAASAKLPPNPPPNGGTPASRPDRSPESVPTPSQAQERTSRPAGPENQQSDSVEMPMHGTAQEAQAAAAPEFFPHRPDAVAQAKPVPSTSQSTLSATQPKTSDSPTIERSAHSSDAFESLETSDSSQLVSPSAKTSTVNRKPVTSSVDSAPFDKTTTSASAHSVETTENVSPSVTLSGSSSGSPSISELPQETSSGTQRQRKSIYQTLETTTQKELKHVEQTQTRVTQESSRMYSTDVPRLNPKKE